MKGSNFNTFWTFGSAYKDERWREDPILWIGFNQTTRLFSDDELACNPCKRGDAVLCLFEYYQS